MNEQNRTLVIIDMQRTFVRECMVDEESIIPVICELVEQAIENKWGIIVVEFYNMGKTIDEITNAIGDYQHQKTVTKNRTDGGKEVVRCLNENDKWSRNLLICGVYGNECVADTVKGILTNSDVVEVDIVDDAISPGYTSRIDEDEYVEMWNRERQINSEQLQESLTW